MSLGVNDQVTNKQLLEEILKSRKELKNSIEASEARLLLKIEQANNRISTLEKENIKLRERLEKVEGENRRNNIVVFGIKRPVGIIDPEFVCGKLNFLLGTELKETDITDIYPIGKSETGPVKVKFASYFKKISVLKNSKKLKGTEISITSDLSVEQRLANKILRKHLTLARLDDKNKNCYIRNNRLFVDGTYYTAEELEELDGQNNTVSKSNSAPPTPIKSSNATGNNIIHPLKQASDKEEAKAEDTPKKVVPNQKSLRSTRATSSSSSSSTK